MFFKLESSKDERKHCFYLLIVEQVYDYSSKFTWGLARYERVRRSFYSSFEQLQASEQLPEGCSLSCYKVFLTDSEFGSLEAKKDHSIGYLSFRADEVFSLITFKNNQQIEHLNPFYRFRLAAAPTTLP